MKENFSITFFVDLLLEGALDYPSEVQKNRCPSVSGLLRASGPRAGGIWWTEKEGVNTAFFIDGLEHLS